MSDIIRLVVVLGLSSFMPFTAVSFFRFRLKQKKDDFQRIVEILELQQESGNDEEPTVIADNVYYPRGFILPVVFVTVLCLVGFTCLFFGDDLLESVGRNLLLAGTSPLADMDLATATERLSLLVLVLAFTSAYLWSCQNVFRRLVTGDLGPGTYYNAGLRMTFAPLLALMVSWLPGADTYGLEALPAVAFLTGIFPERGLYYLSRRIRLFSDHGAQAHELPCDMIEGVNVFHKLRLAEVGVDNAQNLAEAGLVDLLLRTPYRAGQLIDWIAQAKLYLLFKQEIEKLRRVGVRSAFELAEIGDDAELLNELAKAAEISPVLLEVGRRSLAADRQLERLRHYRDLLAAAKAGERRM